MALLWRLRAFPGRHERVEKVLTTPADVAFSICVRERSNWTCERCGKQYTPPTQALHCSHFKGRGNWAVRFDPENAFAHCYGCHSYFEQNPQEFTEWAAERVSLLGIREKANDLQLAKRARKEKAQIADHYRKEHKRMLLKRADGKTGRLEFKEWA